MTFIQGFVSVLFLLAFALSGISASEYFFSKQRFSRRLWLGLTLGLFFLTWLPSLFAFFIGFNLLAQLLGLAVAIALGIVCFFLNKKNARCYKLRKDIYPLIPLIAVFVVGCYLFSTHILLPKNGDLYVGQTTYGDLSMHLGFITSIAEQGFFPPEYSIFAGHSMSYPFMCETSSSSLLLIGSSLRTAYLLPAIWAYALVILGVYNLFELWLKRKGRSVFATLLFFIGGGFGFAYFIDLINGSQTSLSALMNTGTTNNLQVLLEGFYRTPTNIPDLGLRWVNPIVDMLVPQRATLFGWAFLFPCLFLLVDFMKTGRKQNIIPLAILAGGLPLIHTHSFVALAIISAVYFLYDLIRFNKNKQKVCLWLIYAGITVVLAVPQLVAFTFKQTAEGDMIRLWFNWANNVDSFIWFYVKNMGWIFVLMPFAFLLLSKSDRKIYSGVLLLWAVSELILFQPNNYDNNKLLFVWYAFSCAIVTKFLAYMYHKIRHAWNKRQFRVADNNYVFNFAAMSCNAILCVYFLIRPKVMQTSSIGFGTVCTILLVLGFALVMQLRSLVFSLRGKKEGLFIAVNSLCAAINVTMLVGICTSLLKKYSENAFGLSNSTGYFLIVATAFIAISNLILCIVCGQQKQQAFYNPWKKVASSLVIYVLCITMFSSGVLTIIRECKSEYMAYEEKQVIASEFIKENTEPDDLFLTDYGWHINPVSALTGRSILCGADTFLYYHGIDTSDRRADINKMFENPKENLALFEKYGIDYVYIGASERGSGNYVCDIAFFSNNYKTVYSNNNGIYIFDINQPI